MSTQRRIPKASVRRGWELLRRDQVMLEPAKSNGHYVSVAGFNVRRSVLGVEGELPEGHPFSKHFDKKTSMPLDKSMGTSVLRSDQIARALRRFSVREVSEILDYYTLDMASTEAHLDELRVYGNKNSEYETRSIAYSFDEDTEEKLRADTTRLLVALEIGSSLLHPPHLTVEKAVGEAATMAALDGYNQAGPIEAQINLDMAIPLRLTGPNIL